MATPMSEGQHRLADRIQQALDESVDSPWCVHRLYEEVVASVGFEDRGNGLEVTRRAADRLVEAGRARFEGVSAISIGVHCEDALYWSVNSPHTALEQFGPSYESPTILRRLASHFQCHGL
ncbi:MAG: hypothetical protein L3K19_05325 [Thermoplasmata archaeon]|nr:hypothetical protein [Thermoplasmata archaeon]